MSPAGITMRLPEDYSFDPESGIDADFDMYRTSLKKVTVSLIRVSPTAYLDFIDTYFASAPLAQLAQSPWRETEAILTMVFFFGEGCNVNLPSNPCRSTFSLHLPK